MTDDPKTPPPPDLYLAIMEHDEAFHTFMDMMDELYPQTVVWRERPIYWKRRAAKSWHFAEIFGLDPKKVMDGNQ